MSGVENITEFAKTILEKINSGKVFTKETIFEFYDTELDEVTGGLWILASSASPIRVSREASWTAGDEEGAHEDPGNNAEYINTVSEDVKKVFKTFAAEIDKYKVSLQIDDIEEDETVDAEVDVENLSHEDSGIGSYEFWGFSGYDSHPYVDVEGIITRFYDCNVTLFVEVK